MSEEIIRLELLLHHTMLMIIQEKKISLMKKLKNLMKKLKNLMKKLMKKIYMKELLKKYDDTREKDTPTKIPQSVKKKTHQIKYLKV